MEDTRLSGAWQQSAVRCPYCVEGEEFRPMVDLTDLPGGPSFCTRCHHLVHPRENGFKCLCRNCRKLSLPQEESGDVRVPARRVRARRAAP